MEAHGPAKPKWYDFKTPKVDGWVLDLGCSSRPRTEASPRYCSLDIDPRFRPTVLGDAHRLPFRDGSLDAVFAICLLEHVIEPAAVVREVRRVLKPGKRAYISVPFVQYRHDVTDYYRWTEEGLLHLLREFEIESVERSFCGLFSVVIKWFDSGALFLRPPFDRLAQSVTRALLALTAKFDVGKDRFYVGVLVACRKRAEP